MARVKRALNAQKKRRTVLKASMAIAASGPGCTAKPKSSSCIR